MRAGTEGSTGLAQIDVIDARALLEGPVPGAKDWSFIGGVRRSHLDAVAMPVLGWDLSPAYYDYQVFLTHRPSAHARLRVGVVGGDDQFKFSDKSGVDRTDYNASNGFLYFTSSYENQLSNHVTWSHTLAFGRIYQKFEYGSNEAHYLADAPIYPFIGRTEIGWKLLPWANLKLGTDLQYRSISRSARQSGLKMAEKPPRGSFSGTTVAECRGSVGISR